MEDLFRFVSIRPPQSADSSNTIAIDTTSPFQTDLKKARGTAEDAGRSFVAMVELATNYAQGPLFVRDLTMLNDQAQFLALRDQLTAPGATFNLAGVDKLIKNTFGKKAADLVAVKKFNDDASQVFDSILAIFISPSAHKAPVNELVEVAQLVDLIRRVAAGDAALDVPDAVAVELDKTISLPAALFPLRPIIWPVGVADLLVVKQHLKRYELGEISHIENMLKGESKDYTTKHTFQTAQTNTSQTETTTETNSELQTTDRFELKTEAENTLKEDTNVKAGVSATYRYGTTLTVNANVGVSYDKAKTDSNKTTLDHAKDVTSRAASKVTQRVLQSTTTQTVETFEEDNDHKFDNSQGAGNVIGIYQWVNKVYEAQIFNYGQRLMWDITVPEPAAMLLDAATVKANTQAPTPPPPFTVRPDDLSLDPTKKDASGNSLYYGDYVNLYQVQGLDPFPEASIVVSKGYSDKEAAGADVNDNLVKDDVLTIPVGYQASRIEVQGTYNTKATPAGLTVFVGKYNFQNITQDPTVQEISPDDIAEEQSVPIAIETFKVQDYAVTVEVKCTLTDSETQKWKLKTHSAIRAAYGKAYSDYQDKLSALSFQQSTIGPLGSANPDENRKTESVELKKACVALLSGINLRQFNGVQQDPPPAPPTPPGFKSFPMPAVNATTLQQGSVARFFEEAFEWENMTYVFYPYYWGRDSTWYDKLLLDNDDPIFKDFLKAGQARVVIPARRGFEFDIIYFLMTNQIWSGAGQPRISDSDYLPITEEIKAATDAPIPEVAQGDPWEILIPTTLVKLRADGQLPGWARAGDPATLTPADWTWTAEPPDA